MLIWTPLLWLYAGQKKSPLLNTPATASKEQLAVRTNTVPNKTEPYGWEELIRDLERTAEQAKKQAKPASPITSSKPIRHEPKIEERDAVVSLPPYKALGTPGELPATEKSEERREKAGAVGYEPAETSPLPEQDRDAPNQSLYKGIDKDPAILAHGSINQATATTESAETVRGEAAQTLQDLRSSVLNSEELQGKTQIPNRRYLDLIERRISSLWIEPPNSGRIGPLDVLVHFRLHRSGHITDVNIEHSSGDETYDLAAKHAVLSASPLPSFPPDMDLQFLNAHLNFSSQTNVPTP